MKEPVISPEFATALVKVQGSIEGAKKGRSNPQFKSKYADLGAVWDACSDALQKEEIAVLQFPVRAPAGFIGLNTLLVYGPTGEVFGDVFEVPLKDANNAQAAGSALTYARRYALSAIIGICPEDDDGNKAAEAPKAPAKAAGKPQATPTIGASAYRTEFSAATEVEAMKEVYTKVKNSNMEEAAKTALLTEFGTAIKAAKAAQETK
jgi:hypothetical protein